MDKKEFYYDSEEGSTKIHAVKYLPEKDIRGIIQIAHGMMEHMGRYEDFARYAALKGMLVAGNDHLGHGYSIRTENDRGYFGEKEGNITLIKDMRKLTDMLKSEYENIPFFILGHSMGSFLLRQYISIYDDIDGAIIVGTGCKPYALIMSGLLITKVMAYFKGWRYRSSFVNKLTLESNNKYFIAAKTNVDWLSKDEIKLDSYINDKKISFIFTLNGFYNMYKGILKLYGKNYTNKLSKNMPVLILSGDKDPVGNFGKDAANLYKAYSNAGIKNVKYTVYKDLRHEILNELDREIVYDDILNWINEILS